MSKIYKITDFEVDDRVYFDGDTYGNIKEIRSDRVLIYDLHYAIGVEDLTFCFEEDDQVSLGRGGDVRTFYGYWPTSRSRDLALVFDPKTEIPEVVAANTLHPAR